MSRRTWWAALTLMLVVLVVPLLLVEVPPLCDYPNHLARAMFLAFGSGDPVVSRMFAASWAIAPNLAIDLMLPPLLHLMPPLVAGRVLLGIAVLLPATGAIALNYACFGRRSLWALGVGLVVYNAPFLLGFVNFQLSVGVALWGAAAWIWLAPRRPALGVVVGIGFGIATFFSHLFGFAFYGVLIGSFEVIEILRRGVANPAVRRAALIRLAAVAAALAPPVLFYLTSTFAASGGAVYRYGWWAKLVTLWVPVLGYSQVLTIVIGTALVGTVVASLACRRLRVAPLVWLALPLLLIGYILLPTGAKGGFFIDTRVPVLLGFLLLATTSPRLPRSAGTAVMLLLATLFVGRTALIGKAWLGAQPDVAEVRSVLATVTPGSRVLAVIVPPLHGIPKNPSRGISSQFPSAFWHYSAFAYIDRRAFWVDTFVIPGQQPVIALPPYDRLTNFEAMVPQKLEVLERDDRLPVPAGRPQYLARWSSNYDYILVLNAAADRDLEHFLPDRLTFVARQGFAALFKVRRPPVG